MKTILCGDRLGGVLFDIQQYRLGVRDPGTATHRERLIHAIAQLVEVVEEIDERELRTVDEQTVEALRAENPGRPIHSNPRIEGGHHPDGTPMRVEPDHEYNRDILDARHLPRTATICKCDEPVCNGDNNYPKGCYECGGIVLGKDKR